MKYWVWLAHMDLNRKQAKKQKTRLNKIIFGQLILENTQNNL